MTSSPGSTPLAGSHGAEATAHAPAGASLDMRTNLDEPRFAGPKAYNFKKLTYPDGSAEIVATPKRGTPQRAQMETVDLDTGEILDPEPRERSLAEQVAAYDKALCRTRTSIRRAIMGMAATHMLTLTYRENMMDLQRGWKDVSKFLRAMRDSLGGFDYVVVAETQKRGAWHFHLAVRGRQNLKLIRRHWTHGNVDVQQWKGRVAQMAAYMSKYLMKSFDINKRPDGHRYRRSQGTDPRRVDIIVEAESAADVRHIMEVLFREAGLIGFAHCEGGQGTAGHYIWGCTWIENAAPGGSP